MIHVTELQSFLVPSFFSAHREWNLNKVGQQQLRSSKSADVPDVAPVGSSMSALPFPPSPPEDYHWGVYFPLPLLTLST